MIDANAGAGAAEHTTARLALVRLDQIVTRGALPSDVEQRLRRDLEQRPAARTPCSARTPTTNTYPNSSMARSSRRAAMPRPARSCWPGARRIHPHVEPGEINDQVLAAVQRRLDLEEPQII
jgi:hypothetical protein